MKPLFLSLEPIDVMQLPKAGRLRRKAVDAKVVAEYCRTVPPQILWRGLKGQPHWNPSEGAYDPASTVVLDQLNRKLTVLRDAGVPAEFSLLRYIASGDDPMPPHWIASGAHPINVGTVPSARPFAAGDQIVICDFEWRLRRDLPVSAPVFHGNRAAGNLMEHLKHDDLVPVKVQFVILILSR